jgi:hypothetical protein
MEYQEMLHDFLEEYKKEFGLRKYEKIEEKIFESSKISKLFRVAKEKNLVPNYMDYLANLHEIPYFLFAKANTVACAAFIAVERWNIEENTNNRLASDSELTSVLRGILRELF